MDYSKFFRAKCIHAQEEYEKYEGGVNPPIFENSLFTFPDYQTALHAFQGKNDRYIYSRGDNPTIEVLENKIAELEKTDSARMFSSGMAAITASILSCIESGDHIIAVNSCYAIGYKFFIEYLHDKFNVEITFVNGDRNSFTENIKENTKLFYLESPTSITFDLQDLEYIAHLARENNITTIIDNSYCSPYNQNPSQFGIDLIVHSISKYINGHSDVVAGVIAGKQELIDNIKEKEQSILGGIIAPFEAWLILRGLRTLGLRMDKHNENGLEIAKYLEDHPKIENVNYPALPSHTKHDLYTKQMKGAGGLMSFQVNVNSQSEMERFINSFQVFKIAVSWGGYESLILPIFSSLQGLPSALLSNWGIKENLVRLFVGLEETELLKKDLDQALQNI